MTTAEYTEVKVEKVQKCKGNSGAGEGEKKE